MPNHLKVPKTIMKTIVCYKTLFHVAILSNLNTMELLHKASEDSWTTCHCTCIPWVAQHTPDTSSQHPIKCKVEQQKHNRRKRDMHLCNNNLLVTGEGPQAKLLPTRSSSNLLFCINQEWIKSKLGSSVHFVLEWNKHLRNTTKFKGTEWEEATWHMKKRKNP